MEVVAAHDVPVVALEMTAADGTAVDAVHHQSVMDQRGVGALDAVEDGLPVRVGHLPLGPGEEGEEAAEAVEQDLAVGAGVGDPGVLDEGAVGVEAVALRDVREDRREGVTGEGDLVGDSAEDAAQDDGAAQVDAVGAGGGAGVVGEHRVGDEVVDGGTGGCDAVRTEVVVQGGRGVHEEAGAADLPFPPVAVAGGGGVVDGGAEVVEAAEDVREESLVAGRAGAPLDVGLGHGPQAAVAPGDAGRGVVGVAWPEGRGARGHGGAEAAGECAGLGETGGVRLRCRVVSGTEGDAEPASAEGVVGIGCGGAGGRGGGGQERRRE
ncbi:hypothetical protein QF027_006764 [Streptomyces canus]|nr:hypothetical protein [Streptomyces canus]